MGYTKNLKGIWSLLDTDGDGFISLNELDPKAAEALDSFREFLTDKFGNTLEGWKRLDADGNKRLDLNEFMTECQLLGVPGDARYVYHCLKTDVSRSFVCLSDLDPEAHVAQMRGDMGMMTRKKQQKLDRSQTLPSLNSTSASWHAGGVDTATMSSKWNKDRSHEQIALQYQAKKAHQDADLGAKNVGEFKRLLVSRYGTLVAAWRQALDLDGNGRISFGELCLALRELGYNGNVKTAWRMLDKDQDGFIQLADLDPTVEHMMSSYRKAVKDKYGNLLNAWLSSLAKDGHSAVTKEVFANHCRELGWSGNVSHLFESLKNDTGRRVMFLRDYDVAAAHAYGRGDFDMLTEAGTAPQCVMQMTFLERNQNGFTQRWARSQSKTMIDTRQEMGATYRAKDKGADDINSMRDLLIKKYGTITAAWRHGFEGNENGKVSFVEFCTAMRRLGYNGNIKECFRRLGATEKGVLTLEDLDPQAHALVTEFRSLLLNKYGTYIKAWAALDENRNNQLEEHELVSMCAKLGYTKNAKKLFRYLLDHPSKRIISMGDLDPAAMRAYYRGDLDALSPQEKAKAKLLQKQEAEKQAKSKMLGAQDLRGLKRELIKKYRTAVAAWRFGLDVHGVGKLSRVMFFEALRNIGFIGEYSKCFFELDNDQSGIITFNEFDHKWCAKLESFQSKLLGKYITYEAAWKAIDSNGNNTIDCMEFVEVCRVIGYEDSAAQLFRQLLKNPGHKTIALEDLISGGYIVNGVSQSLNLVKRNSDLLDIDAKARLQLAQNAAIATQEKNKLMIAHDWPSLKKQFLKKYFTSTGAWRNGLDPLGNGLVGLVEFSKVCREIGFAGVVEDLFQEIDANGRGVITFDMIDSKWCQRHVDFIGKLMSKYETYEDAWKGIDVNRSNTIDCDEFEKVCADIGYCTDAEQAKQLFKQFVIHPAQRCLSLEDLQAIGVIARKSAERPKTPKTPKSADGSKRVKRDPHQTSHDEQLAQELQTTDSQATNDPMSS